MKEEYQFIQNFYKGIIEDQIFLESTVKGCNKYEILKIEHKLKQSLPRSIKEFLSFSGKQWKGIYALHSLQKILLSDKPYDAFKKEKTFSEEQSEFSTINEREIIIINYQEHLGDYSFNFFYRKDESENPQIYTVTYQELHKDSTPFTEYIENLLRTVIKFSKKLFVNDYNDFSLALTYINHKAINILSINSHEASIKSPEMILKLPNIEELIFGKYNSLHDKKELWVFEIPYTTSLKKLRISRDELKDLIIPEKGLPNLEELIISSKNLQTIPKNIDKCHNLNKIIINKNLIKG